MATFLSVERTAHELGISHATLRRWLKRGEVTPTSHLNSERQPIFSRDEVERLKREHRSGD